MSVDTPQETPAKAEKKLTSYDVYSTGDDGATLRYVGRVEAINDIKAIQQSIGDADTGSYLAIPQRSLRIRTVSSTSVPKVVIS